MEFCIKTFIYICT